MSDASKGSIARDGEFVVIRVPEAEVHGLCVALRPCPTCCREVKSNTTKDIRERLRDGLKKALAIPKWEQSDAG